MLGLRCCTQAVKRGYSLVAVSWSLGFRVQGLWQLLYASLLLAFCNLLALGHVGFSSCGTKAH